MVCVRGVRSGLRAAPPHPAGGQPACARCSGAAPSHLHLHRAALLHGVLCVRMHVLTSPARPPSRPCSRPLQEEKAPAQSAAGEGSHSSSSNGSDGANGKGAAAASDTPETFDIAKVRGAMKQTNQL